jgi:hypothetical protein
MTKSRIDPGAMGAPCASEIPLSEFPDGGAVGPLSAAGGALVETGPMGLGREAQAAMDIPAKKTRARWKARLDEKLIVDSLASAGRFAGEDRPLI